MLRCEAETMDVIDAMLMEDEELMAELEAQLYDEVETYTEDMFESEADWDDFNICSIEDDYIFNNMSIIEILDERNCDFTVRQWVDSFHVKHCLITIDADHNENIHWYRKAFANISHIAGYVQRKKRDEFIFNDCTVYIQY